MNQQPHIGRQVSHFHRVNVDGIEAVFSDDLKYRYRLSVPFLDEAGRTKVMTVVLKNPSSADALRADKTVQNVEKVIYKTFTDVRKIEVLNLFALRGTRPKDVMETYTAGTDIVGSDNDKAFRGALAQSDYIVIAWGAASPIRSSLYDARIDDVMSMIDRQKFTNMIFRKKEKGSDKYPFHACYWPDTKDFSEYLFLH